MKQIFSKTDLSINLADIFKQVRPSLLEENQGIHFFNLENWSFIFFVFQSFSDEKRNFVSKVFREEVSTLFRALGFSFTRDYDKWDHLQMGAGDWEYISFALETILTPEAEVGLVHKVFGRIASDSDCRVTARSYT